MRVVGREGSRLSEIRQSEKDNSPMVSLISGKTVGESREN